MGAAVIFPCINPLLDEKFNLPMPGD